MTAREDTLPEEAVRLIEAAKRAAGAAYAPYSGFPVGAAVQSRSGAVYTGVNVENAAYPVGLCAERAAAAAAVAKGEPDLVALAVAPGRAGVDDLPPCGMCLQFLGELAPGLAVVMKERGRWVARPLSTLLTAPFRLSGGLHPGGGAAGDTSAARPPLSAAAGPAGLAPADAGIRLERLRRPAPTELAQLAAYETEAFGPVGLRAVDLAVAAEAGAVYRAWHRFDGDAGPTLIGSCQLFRTIDEPRILYLVGFHVLPAYRGRGLGRLFVRALLTELPGLQADALVLTVSPGNTAALALYRGAGFEEAGSLLGFYGLGEDRLLLRYRPEEG